MNPKLIQIYLLLSVIVVRSKAQISIDSIFQLRSKVLLETVSQTTMNEQERRAFFSAYRTAISDSLSNSFQPLVRLQTPMQTNMPGGTCTNIDFEMGNATGWTQTNGFAWSYSPTVGCCTLTNLIDQTIMSGTGNDQYGGFPVVDPLGGSFSMRLGSNIANGRADRISQTFFVTSTNTLLTLRYAAVLNDHPMALSNRNGFTILLVDSNDNIVDCGGQTAIGTFDPGMMASPASTPYSKIVFKPWTTKYYDLSALIGQNVTLEITAYDAGASYFSYIYIDG